MKQISIIIILVLIGATLFGLFKLNNVFRETLPDYSFYLKNRLSESGNEEETERIKEEKPDFPLKKVLKVPFVLQAPLQNWQIHKESCEEAALLILVSYQKGENLSKESQNKELLKMKEFQKERYVAEKDLINEDFIRFSRDYAGINLKTLKDFTLEDIKREINAGNPLIVPVAAKYLKNPYYPHPGYHMLVIIGYDNETIITNDPGTRHGQGFEYSFQKIKKAGEDYGNAAFVIDNPK